MSVALGCTCKHLMLHPPLLARANHVAAKKTHKTFGMRDGSKLGQDIDIYHQLYGEYENADFLELVVRSIQLWSVPASTYCNTCSL